MEAQPLISVMSSRTLTHEETAKALKSFLKKNSKENVEGSTVGSADLLEKLATVLDSLKQSKGFGEGKNVVEPKTEKKEKRKSSAIDIDAGESAEKPAKKKKHKKSIS